MPQILVKRFELQNGTFTNQHVKMRVFKQVKSTAITVYRIFHSMLKCLYSPILGFFQSFLNLTGKRKK